MLYALKTLILLGLIEFVWATALQNKQTKPDMQKVYEKAKTWSKAKLAQMPDTKDSQAIASTGVCRGASIGEPLMISPPCPKKQSQPIDDVVDAAISQGSESSRKSHPDILSPSTNQMPKILVFLSFSMPKASLRSLAKEASKHNAVLVIKGLKDDSFKTTQQALLEVAGQNLDQKVSQDMQGFEINPDLFKTYQIKKVPTFVLVKNFKEISRLSGNVSLAFAAKKLNEDI